MGEHKKLIGVELEKNVDGIYRIGHQLQAFIEGDVEQYIKCNFEHYSKLDLDVKRIL